MTDLNKIRAAQVRAAEQAAIADLPPELLTGLAPAIPAPEGAQELPPLPEPEGIGYYREVVSAAGTKHVYRQAPSFTADQMHAYARAALAAPAPQAPAALTDEQIRQAGESIGSWPSGFGDRDMRFARAIEAAHGITQTKEPTNDR